MRFIVDECTGPSVAQWLREQKHEVFSIYDDSRGLDDESILQKAAAEDYILITNDKDFGELIFRDKKTHKGVVLLRLDDERAANKIRVLKILIERYADQLNNNFVVVTENAVRITRVKG